MLIHIDIYFRVNLSIKLVWVVIVGCGIFGRINSTNIYFVCFWFSVCVCVIHSLICIFGVIYLNSFVIRSVSSGYVSLNHSLGQVNINPPGSLNLPYKSILV